MVLPWEKIRVFSSYEFKIIGNNKILRKEI